MNIINTSEIVALLFIQEKQIFTDWNFVISAELRSIQTRLQTDIAVIKQNI